MGLFFRKSVNFGPVRLNFSKSGVGVSAGVRGARISTGPRGSFIQVGRNGVYYRQKIGAAAPVDQSAAEPAPRPPDFEPEPLSELAAFLGTEREKADHRNFVIIGLTSLTILVCIACAVSGAIMLREEAAWGVGFSSLALGCLLTYFISRLRYEPRYTIQYDLDDQEKVRFARLTEAIWQFSQAGHLSGIFDNSQTWRPAAVVREAPPYVETELHVYALKATGNQSVYVLPDQLLITRGAEFHSLRYATAQVGYRTAQAAQTGAAAGMEVVGRRWLHTRVNGLPDMRYKYNPTISTVAYGQVVLTGVGGQAVVIQTSPSVYARQVAEVFLGPVKGESPQREPSGSSGRGGRSDGQAGGSRSDAGGRKSPYEILGVSRDASREEIAKAYRTLVQQYHPDKVAHLAPEFQEMAERKMREINDAYERLNRKP